MLKQHVSKSQPEFRDALLAWFKKYQRTMPWRGLHDPYLIWVSEVMLQQTQVKKVVAYYERFIKRFPDVQQLADAPLQDVLKLWEGLGYYARARNLHKAAQCVVDEFDGEIPRDYATFKKLPGVGDYSAAAVQSIAFNAPYAAVDGNIKRVLARLYLIDTPINETSSAKLFQQKADDLLDQEEPGLFNQAMMELGATVCRPQSPTCLACPVNQFCKAFHAACQDKFPRRIKTAKVPEHHIAAGVIYKESKVLIVQRPLNGLLGGLWEFPNEQIGESETAEQACIRCITDIVNLSVTNLKSLTRVRHAFTHFKIVVDVFECEYQSGEVVLNGPIDAKWVEVAALQDYPLPRATHKFLDKLNHT
ncbi:A/G-specific adenine glycosylase [Candidatus Poribacteria bacterium]|nr:MAG: A/G-specific adenine glycosylase [Candidatus Poribacteria bacterium]